MMSYQTCIRCRETSPESEYCPRLALFFMVLFALIGTDRAVAQSALPDTMLARRDTLIVPASVIPGAVKHLKARVGDRFYRKCIILSDDRPLWVVEPPPEDINSNSRHPRMMGSWKVHFNLADPSKSFVRGLITASVDSSGLPVESFPVEGIGDCVEHPEECRFPIDEKKALQIAKRDGLKRGIGPWEANFVWNYRSERYLWVVKNTLHDRGGGYKDGDILSIDAATGEVHSKNMVWGQIP